MKKFTILTSLLALTACGGGGHGGSGAPAVPFDLNANLLNAVDSMDFANSDGESMKFKIENGNLVSVTTSSEDGEQITWNRTNGNKFQINNWYAYGAHISYSDVRDQLAANGISYTGHIVTDTANPTALANRDALIDLLAERNITLIEKSGITLDATDRQKVRDVLASFGEFEYTESIIHSATLDMNSAGKDLGLAYSDFGSIETVIDLTEGGKRGTFTEHSVYVGGYAPNKLAEKPAEDMTFNGSAIAAVNYWQDEDDIDISKVYKTGDAQLKLESGKEILTMNFANADDPWYNVTIDSTNPLPIIDVTEEASARIVETNHRITDDLTQQWRNPLNAAYYGPDGSATEATASVDFEMFNVADDKGINVDAAFGGKR